MALGIAHHPIFDGATFDAAEDGTRLRSQMERVFEVMRDGRWHSLSEIRAKVGGTDSGITARLRDLRKPRFGGHSVNCKRVSGGLYLYQVIAVGTQGELPL